LDSGSQRSYITEQVATKLKLPFEPVEKLSVVTFGTDRPKTVECKLSNVQLCLKDKTFMTMKVTVVPNITGKISRVPMKPKDIEFLKNEFNPDLLADTIPCHFEPTLVDMLIGSDYYFDLLEPHKMDLGGGLYLFNSRLGWVLGGRINDTTVNRNPVPSLLVRTVGTVPVQIKQTTHMLSNIDLSLACKPNSGILKLLV